MPDAPVSRNRPVLNIDSFTEMPLDQSKAYFQFAADRCKALYSMNHELNPHRTMEIASLAGIRTLPIRHASAFRRGYVEELYFFEITRHKDPKGLRALLQLAWTHFSLLLSALGSLLILSSGRNRTSIRSTAAAR